MILASQSPRRRQLLEEAGFTLTCLPADIDESRHQNEAPCDLVSRLAYEKAQDCLSCLTNTPEDGLLVAADTIVWMNDTVLGKPKDAADAAHMLEFLSGKTHCVSTGVCVLLLSPMGELEDIRRFVETTSVSFYPLTPDEIAAYVATGEPLDKAGAYGIQGLARIFVKHLEGDYTNVVGLPLARLVHELADLTHNPALIPSLLKGSTHE